ncbi:MAG: VOC family protein [Cyclobacteriaceae bacterium]|nr:VOC family protein [Cyclobacteriaceae bacterium HetDA_MAG_MS6]
MSEVIISGIQQIGIGVSNVHEAWKWYRQNFGMDVKVFEEAATADLMLPYTGGKPHDRHAILAINLQAGGGFEIWQYTSRTPQPSDQEVLLGDLGFFCAKIKTKDAKAAHELYRGRGIEVLNEPTKDPRGHLHFYLKDLYGNIFDVVEGDGWFKDEKKLTSGSFGMTIGCTDLEKSIAFYGDILGYDQVLYKGDAVEDMTVVPGGSGKFKRAILTHSKPRLGGFSKLFGNSEIELVAVEDRKPNKIFEGRYWGDLGYIHLCFDIHGMDALRKLCEEKGHPFTVDSFAGRGESFDMGEAAGHFSYIEDPDGALIEFVETHKIPIIKKIGWYLDLRKKDPRKPLPNYILKAMGLNRVKD